MVSYLKRIAHKGPPRPPSSPVLDLSPRELATFWGTTPPAGDGAVDTRAGWWARRDVVARGWVDGWMGPCGCQALGEPKSVKERVAMPWSFIQAVASQMGDVGRSLGDV